jgi:hypothetical protein
MIRRHLPTLAMVVGAACFLGALGLLTFLASQARACP